MKTAFLLLVILLVFTLSGCGIMINSVREILNYPSMELLKAREDALRRSFDISYDEAFKRVIVLANEMDALIYMKNKKDHFITLMEIEGSIDTTEVGIFFSEEADDKTFIEIASHSPKAKRIVSSKIFGELIERKEEEKEE